MSEITPITREEKLWNGEDLEPLTREEMYIKRIFDKTQTIPDKPLTRKEILMEKAGEGGGGDVTIKQLSVTANGTYSEEGTAYSPVNVAVPLAEKSMTENGIYNASDDSVAGYSKVNVNVPLPENAYLLKTASGSLVSFSDGADLPIPSFVCDIDAVQDLHGYDAPWVGGAGKNKLQNTKTTREINGVTFTVNSDGSVTANGTATAEAQFTIPIDTNTIYGDLYFVGCSGGSNSTYNVFMWDNTTDSRVKKWNGTTNAAFSVDGTLQEIKIVQGNTVNMVLRVMSRQTVNNVIFQPMICLSTETDATFAPYSNICPISGHIGVNAWVRGKNLLPLTLDNVKALNAAGTWSGNTYTHPTGVTFTFTTNNDGSITSIKADGTSPSSNVTLYLQQNITNSTYPNEMTVSGCPSGGGSSTYKIRCQMQPSPNTTIADDFGEGANFTIPNDGKNYQVIIRIQSGVTVSNLMFYPMIRPASIQDSTFEPYNTNSQTINVSWQTEAGEVFGGYVDLVSGELTVTHKSQTGFTRGSQDSSNKLYNIGTISDIKTFNDSNAISPYFINNMFEKMSLAEARATEAPSIIQYSKALYIGGYIGKAAELDTLLESLQVKYELETPIFIQLDGNQIKSLLGNNNAWASTGDVVIDYFAKEVEG